ncbi:helix-turn-helix transcriptional regulator [Photobacterium sp. TY1-4]|uniref:helix-turn-helix transcriptional regulator n=1 Tax=Photobacterium sp. TY1-4 TaxID=2899122 RepID=UPI0021BF2EBF|nr:helix-turn-helix transcriptional regulator [Photobacterium sp. TY1-4]UXI02031.1 LuxR C-terminal-related transcriptional regulator [Photobacterium sp. TY1-4]
MLNPAETASPALDATAGAIAALRMPQFTAQFVALLSQLIDFDCVVILGYRQGKHPIYLYDSIQRRRELLFQRYLTDSFLQDPFYLALTQGAEEGVYSLSEVSRRIRQSPDYRQQFYDQTGWEDEVSLSVRLDPTRWIVVYLGYLDRPLRAASPTQLAALKQHYGVLRALCVQHWQPADFSLAQPPGEQAVMRLAVDQALASFGQSLLTAREQQVTALLVQGLDSREIAEALDIGIGTVKNHRKRIYAQLKVSSLSELFQLFLNHLIAAT